MKASVFSLGCKVNQYEGQAIIAALCENGVDATDKLVPADIYVINTCSVTGEADRKSRQTVARMLKLNPNAKIYVCGCSSQNNPAQFDGKPNVRIISGTAKKTELVPMILSDINKENCAAVCCVSELPAIYEDNLYPHRTKTRSCIKIQDGCNNFCSYCIIPYLRGRSRSRSIDSIVREANTVSEQTKEIVVTGINTSAYGADIGESLVSLVKRLKDVPARKRFGSLECTVISDELLDAMATSGFCDHFHLSLQSGSETVLKRMNRKYTPEFYLKQVERIRKVFPQAGITTDVIAGFGGETEEEFAETKEFVQAVKFSEMHVFPYSERKGTKACALPQIDKSLRAERTNVLIEIGKKLSAEFCSRQIGNVAEVYAETREGGESAGYTSNYIKVYSGVPVGEIKKVKIKNLYKEGVQAEIYEE